MSKVCKHMLDVDKLGIYVTINRKEALIGWTLLCISAMLIGAGLGLILNGVQLL